MSMFLNKSFLTWMTKIDHYSNTERIVFLGMNLSNYATEIVGACRFGQDAWANRSRWPKLCKRTQTIIFYLQWWCAIYI